jgi:hypothetical protein
VEEVYPEMCVWEVKSCWPWTNSVAKGSPGAKKAISSLAISIRIGVSFI